MQETKGDNAVKRNRKRKRKSSHKQKMPTEGKNVSRLVSRFTY